MTTTAKLVKLVSISQPVSKDFIEGSVAEDIVAYCARVSNPSNQTNFDTAGSLLEYCVKHKHWSIFEQVHLTFEVNTTRDIARQILRHRSFSFQEFSQRYADPTQLGFTIREARLQDKKNRQNSIETSDEELQQTFIMKQEQIIHEARMAYKWAIDNGIAKEQARVFLPEGLTNSRLYVAGSLRSWIHFVQVRADKSTQKEHRQIAEEAKSILLVRFPSLHNVFEGDNDDYTA